MLGRDYVEESLMTHMTHGRTILGIILCRYQLEKVIEFAKNKRTIFTGRYSYETGQLDLQERLIREGETLTRTIDSK